MNATVTEVDARAFTPQKTLRRTKDGRAYLLAHGLVRPDESGSDVRPFVAWDGEGITYDRELQQSYVLFGNSLGLRAVGERLSTDECLELIITTEQQAPHSIHVGFAFKYDVEMILWQLPRRHWECLHRHGSVGYKGYRLTYHPGKRFTVTYGRDKQRVTATVYDVWGFFQGSFVNALRGWLDEDELTDIDKIEHGKGLRGTFQLDQLTSLVVPYWESELRLTVKLCDRLRERLDVAGIVPKQWHGPGAVATVVYRQHGTRERMSRSENEKAQDKRGRDEQLADTPTAVSEAAQYAYAGGRFELFQLGDYDGPVWQYDINSAYPNAISRLPNLSTGRWERTTNLSSRTPFAVYRIEYDGFHPLAGMKAHPLFHRDENHCISYPMTVNGWYWYPEARIVAEDKRARIVDGWVYHDDGSKPFQFVEVMYETRRAWKAAGNPAERALKLALNSLYGKMAQRAGWEPGKPLPRYHQLEWAGWVTSYTRAMLWEAMQAAGAALIACETDAVFTTKPLQLPVSERLGEWGVTQYDGITYLANGVYWTSDGKAKFRGHDIGTLTRTDALTWLRNGDWTRPLVGYSTRFVGSGRGLRTTLPIWRAWVTEPVEVRPGSTGKRVHVPALCAACNGNGAQLHRLTVRTRGGDSTAHSVPWAGHDIDEDANTNPFRNVVWLERWDG